jgi:LysM repeat protein/N-acetyl-anhydromuramyl-L-alanine amidase AmpD
MISMNIEKKFLTPNKWSRPQTRISKVRAVVWHWFANPNTSALANRNYFENRKLGKTNFGSAHYLIGLKGEIVQALPENEMAYHVGSTTYTSRAIRELGSYPNSSTIGIECAHIDLKGKMNSATYNALIELTADILKRNGLGADDIWTHQEVVGWKDCHRWFVNNPAEYKKAKQDVAKLLNQKTVTAPKPVDTKDVVLVEASADGTYTVQKGDTFWEIAQALDMDVKDIEKLNPDVDAKSLKVGQKIKVASVSISEHVIAKGDTLWEIAGKYNTTVAKLEELNKGLKATALQVGAKIAIPSSAAPVKATPSTSSHKHSFTKLGRVKGNVYSHTKPDFEASTRDAVVVTNDSVKICCEENGLYYTDKKWISTKYIDIVGSLSKVDLPSAVLKRGSKGSAVVQVQRALNQLNFKCGAEDGVYGKGTEDAVKRFQMVYLAKGVDGVYGKNTELKMEALINK